MKCLVTGGAGFIGSNLVDKLLDLGHNVVVIDNEFSDVHEQFYWNHLASNYRYDICDYKNTRFLYDGIDCVFHLAAEARIQPSILNPIETIKINSLGTCTVLQCAREAKVKKVVYSSSSSGYGMNPYPNVETQPDDCLNPYSVSKINGEKLCKVYNDLYGLQTICLRYFNVYGERQPLKGQYTPVVGIFLRQHKNGEPLTVVGDGEQRRDFTYVGDVINANLLAANSVHNGLYNVGTGKNYSINEVARMISDNIVYIPARPAEARITLADNMKMRNTFGWKPQMQLEDWVKANL